MPALFGSVVALPDGEPVVLLDIGRLPGVADPDVADGARGDVAALVDHVGRQLALLFLVFVLDSLSAN